MVAYRFTKVPSRCQPTSLDIVVDVNDDPLPGRSIEARTPNLRGKVKIDLPAEVRTADVVRAIARTARGAPSEATMVRIQVSESLRDID